jgi:hypothetical protein
MLNSACYPHAVVIVDFASPFGGSHRLRTPHRFAITPASTRMLDAARDGASLS